MQLLGAGPEFIFQHKSSCSSSTFVRSLTTTPLMICCFLWNMPTTQAFYSLQTLLTKAPAERYLILSLFFFLLE